MTPLGEMPLLNDYSLCRDTVTVYHEEDGEVTRIVWPRAYLERRKGLTVGRNADSESSGFLLVIPGDAQACHVGDKVVLGEGPLVPPTDVAQWWRSLIPSKVEGLVVVRNVSARRWNGRIVHTEAGG